MTKSNLHVEVSIVIVSYRCWNHLRDCLNALVAIRTENLSKQIIVVDNNSNDGKLEHFALEFPSVKFILNDGNNGFAHGCNLGAREAKGDYLLFLNPDTIASDEAISEMLKYAKANDSWGIVSCLQKNKNGSFEQVHRLFPSPVTLFGLARAVYKFFSRKKINVLFDPQKLYVFPDWVSGSVVMMSREWFNKTAGWNEDYWMYFEDVDLSKRVFNLGGKVAVIQTAEIIHNHGGASRINFETASLTKTEVLISKHVYIQNHFSGIRRLGLHTLLMVNNILSKLLLAILGLLLVFIPKMKLQLYLAAKLFGYYVKAIKRGTWLSERSLQSK